MSTSITGSKGGGGKARTPVEAPDSLHSVAYARILDLVSEGEIFGLVDGLKSIYLDETPLSSDGTALNFEGVTVSERKGTQLQSYIPGIPAVENETAIGVELRSDQPWVRAITNLQLSAVRVRLSTPRLVKQDPSTGDTGGYTVKYAIDVAVVGGAYAEVLSTAFSGKTTTKYERSHRIDLPPSTTGWNIRVRRITPNETVGTIADITNIEALTEIIDAKFRYPNSALVGLQFDARQFSKIPRRAFHLKGRLIKIPTNYDPELRTYTGVWNGTFKIAYSNNPAWVYYDLLLNDRYGLGHILQASQVDKWELYRIAQYCDTPVADGKGGVEPRFVCNLYLQTRQEALKVLQDISGIFRGMSYWGGGAVMASADMPDDPVYTYTNANVVDGKFKYSGTSRKSRLSVALVSWNDPTDFYRAKVEYVEDRESLARYGHRETQITAFGCTSQGQAQRLGRWALLTNKLETETVNFSVGLDGVLVRPGQVVRVADNDRAGRRIGGRLFNASLTNLVLDMGVEVNPGDTITVVNQSGVAVSRSIQTVVASTTWDKTTLTWDSSTLTFDEGTLLQEVTLATPLEELPPLQSVWAIDSSSLMTQRFRVLSIRENFQNGKAEYEITATQHIDGKYAAIDTNTRIDLPPITSIPPSVQPPPTNVEVSSDYAVSQGLAMTTMAITWDPAPSAVAYEIQWRMNERDWVYAGRTGSTRFEVQGIIEGRYVARVRAINSFDIPSIWASSIETQLDATGAPPEALTFLTAEPMVFGIRVKWGFPNTLDAQRTQRTELWYSASNLFESATKLGDYAYPQNDMNLIGLQAGVTFYFWARLVDKTGNVGPWSGPVEGTSSTDSTAILEYLVGKVTETHLGQSLFDEIALISGTQPGSVDARLGIVRSDLESQISTVAAQVAEIQGAPDYDPLETYAVDDLVKSNGAIWKAISSVPTNTPPPNATYWTKVGDYASLGDMVVALAAEVDSLDTQVTALDGELAAETTRINNLIASVDGNTAAITAEAQTRANADSAFATQLQTLQATVEDNAAAIVQESQTRATETSSLADQMNTVVATVNTASADAAAAQAAAEQAAADAASAVSGVTSVLIQSATPTVEQRKPNMLWIDTTNGANTPRRWNGSTWAAITDKAAIDAANAAAQAQATANAANSTANSASAAVQTQSQALADTNNKLSAMYTIKTAVRSSDGKTYIASLGVGVENNKGVVESQVVVAANRFVVIDPNGSGLVSPFTISGGQVFINSAVIGTAAITEAKIASAAITNAKIANAAITAAKIADGNITNAKIANAAITEAKIANASITNAKIANASVDTLKIGGNSVTVPYYGQVAANGVNFGAFNSPWMYYPDTAAVSIVASGAVDDDATVTLRVYVYNSAGSRIAEVVSGSGKFSDGRAETDIGGTLVLQGGITLGPGSYYFRIESNIRSILLKMLIIGTMR